MFMSEIKYYSNTQSFPNHQCAYIEYTCWYVQECNLQISVLIANNSSLSDFNEIIYKGYIISNCC